MSRNAPARKVARLVRKSPLVPVWRARRGRPEFSFDGQRLPYFYHRSNYTWANERAVELAIGSETLRRYDGQRVLEVGNVMSQYFGTRHTVVDKYERAPGVINRDIVEYEPDEPYDLILSISTLEHVGWDEQPRDAEKIPRAIARMMSWLAPRGEMLVIVPVGYNPHLNAHLQSAVFQPFAKRYLRRISADNRWEEARWTDVCDAKYHEPYDWANALAVCRYFSE
jgi:hypothetical protein